MCNTFFVNDITDNQVSKYDFFKINPLPVKRKNRVVLKDA